MPTDVTSTIGSSGRDYSTLQAWEDACPANLVTDDKRWIGECYNDSEFSGTTSMLTIGGITTDSTRYPYLRCATGQSFSDNASVRTNALYYNASNGVAIKTTNSYTGAVICNINYVRFKGLQINASHASGTIGVYIQTAGPLDFEDCIIQGGAITLGVDYGFNGGVNCRNCLLVLTSSGYVIRNAVDSTFYGCTFIKSGSAGEYALRHFYGTCTVKNCALFNFTGNTSGSGTNTITYSATDQASMAGTGNVTSLTYADQFESTTNDFRAKSTGDLQAGTPDSTNTPDDITGLTRDATTPWIGCWEVAGGGGGTVRPRSLLTLGCGC